MTDWYLPSLAHEEVKVVEKKTISKDFHRVFFLVLRNFFEESFVVAILKENRSLVVAAVKNVIEATGVEPSLSLRH